MTAKRLQDIMLAWSTCGERPSQVSLGPDDYETLLLEIADYPVPKFHEVTFHQTRLHLDPSLIKGDVMIYA